MKPEVMRARLRPGWAGIVASVLGLVVAAVIIGGVSLVHVLVARDARDDAGSRLEIMLRLEGDVRRMGLRDGLPPIEELDSLGRPVVWR